MVTMYSAAPFARESEFHRAAFVLAPHLQQFAGPDLPLHQVLADFRVAVEVWHKYLSATLLNPPSLALVWDEVTDLIGRHGIYAVAGIVARAVLVPWLLRRAALSDAHLVHLGWLLEELRERRLAALGL